MNHSGSFLTFAGLLLGLGIPTQAVYAQGRQPSTPASGPASQPQPGGSLNQPPRGLEGTTLDRGWYLSGRVLLDDGNPPPDTVTIQRICGAAVRPMGYTDSKGRFSFQLGQTSGIVPDASVGSSDDGGSGSSRLGSSPQRNPLALGSAPNIQMANCQLQADLPGYRSDVLELSGRRYMENPDVGTIILHRLHNVDGASISATSYEAPNDAKKAYDKGLDSVKKQKWPEAQAQFEKAVGIYPKYAAAWFELGRALEQQGDKPKARDAFRKSIEADSRFLKPYFPLATIAMAEKNWTETVELTSTLTRLDPVDYPAAFLFNAIASMQLNNLDQAEKSAREAVRLDTNHRLPRAEYLLGIVLADKHNYDGSLALLRSYIQRAPNAPDAENIKKQIGQIEELARAQPGAAPAAQPAPQQ